MMYVDVCVCVYVYVDVRVCMYGCILVLVVATGCDRPGPCSVTGPSTPPRVSHPGHKTPYRCNDIIPRARSNISTHIHIYIHIHDPVVIPPL